MSAPLYVFIDSCAVNRFAAINLDPFKALAGSVFAPAATPELAAEYRRALAHPYVEPHIKTLLRKLIDGCATVSASESDARGADWDLVVLSQTRIVITDDTKPPWNRAEGHPGLLLWPDLEAALRRGEPLSAVLQARIALLVRACP